MARHDWIAGVRCTISEESLHGLDAKSSHKVVEIGQWQPLGAMISGFLQGGMR